MAGIGRVGPGEGNCYVLSLAVVSGKGHVQRWRVSLQLHGSKVSHCAGTVIDLNKARQGQDDHRYNPRITISHIPQEAYAYVVNGRSTVEWIMERYQIKTDKASGITNEPND